jgi:putative two-component system protein, hydrogenase maturation factor HypX/HoxX
MRILLLSSAFNGLTQRAWLELRAAGHDVSVELALSAELMVSAVTRFEPDLIICPFLRERVPSEIWARHRTIIVHPGPRGDRGPSSLDWAITTGQSLWGVTALQAVEEMDAGPIWGSRTFPLRPGELPKSAVYNGPVADAAIELIREVVAKADDPLFTPEPLDYTKPDVIGRLQPATRIADREFSWDEPADEILRRIRAADGSPGARTTLCDVPVAVFDAHPGPTIPGRPGTVQLRHHDAVLVRAGDRGVWIGQLRTEGAVKLPAAAALASRLREVPDVLEPLDEPAEHAEHIGRREIGYRRHGDVGVLSFDFYNGAMSTGQCRRLSTALRHATSQPTKVLLIRGADVFSNGIHLNVIDAAPCPAFEAWRNINAIDDVCHEIITCTTQLVVTAIRGSAGAGGVVLALGADRVVVRAGAVLNPHYATMGLYGSEYWTYVLPRRVGDLEATALTEQCLPIGSARAARIGLVDDVLTVPRDEFDAGVLDYTVGLARSDRHRQLLERKRAARAAAERRKPLQAYRVEELAEMSRDLFDDRNGFASLRRAFTTKQKPAATPARLARHHPTTQVMVPVVDAPRFAG